MTTIAINAANRSFSFFETFLDAFDKAVAMTKAIKQDCPSAEDVKKVRAIAETI